VKVKGKAGKAISVGLGWAWAAGPGGGRRFVWFSGSGSLPGLPFFLSVSVRSPTNEASFIYFGFKIKIYGLIWD